MWRAELVVVLVGCVSEVAWVPERPAGGTLPAEPATPALAVAAVDTCVVAETAGAPMSPAPVEADRCEPQPSALAPCRAGVAAWSGDTSWTTLADALALAPPGAEVVVCPGVHAGGVTVADRVLRAADPTPDATVVDGAGAEGPVVTVSDATLHGFTVRGGTRAPGVVATGEVTLRCATLTEHTAGALWATGPLHVHDSLVSHNTSEVGAAGLTAGCGLELQHTVVSDNHGLVGNLVASAAGLFLWDSAFTDNSGDEIGALEVRDFAGGEVLGSTFRGNRGAITSALDLGGDATGFETTLEGSTFVGNDGQATVRAHFEGDAVVWLRGVVCEDNDGDCVSTLPPEWVHDPSPEVVDTPWATELLGVDDTRFVGNRAVNGVLSYRRQEGVGGGAGEWSDNAPCDLFVPFVDGERDLC